MYEFKARKHRVLNAVATVINSLLDVAVFAGAAAALTQIVA